MKALLTLLASCVILFVLPSPGVLYWGVVLGLVGWLIFIVYSNQRLNGRKNDILQ